jgi:hypothetical protein
MITEIIQVGTLITMAITIVGVPVLIYKAWEDRDKKQDKDLTNVDKSVAVGGAVCVQKHARIDEIFKEVKESIKGIDYTFAHFKENEFRHIEDNTNAINVKIAGVDGKIDMLVSMLGNKNNNNNTINK